LTRNSVRIPRSLLQVNLQNSSRRIQL